MEIRPRCRNTFLSGMKGFSNTCNHILNSVFPYAALHHAWYQVPLPDYYGWYFKVIIPLISKP